MEKEIKLIEAGSLEHYGNDQMNRVYDASGLAPTITAKSGGGREPKVDYLQIRKFTEEECFRLMGVKTEDYEKIKCRQKSGSQYHLAGDSIVTTCLMAIFGEMFDIDYETIVEQTAKEIANAKRTDIDKGLY